MISTADPQTVANQSSLELLNRSVADELHAVHQYMYFHFHLDDQGLGPLARLFKQTAIVEMGHIEKLAERILFLKGEVEMAAAESVATITDPSAMLAKAAEMEQGSARDYNRAAQQCAALADAGTQHIFEQLVADEESHLDRFEKQLDHIKRFGPSYLALQSFGALNEPPGAE